MFSKNTLSEYSSGLCIGQWGYKSVEAPFRGHACGQRWFWHLGNIWNHADRSFIQSFMPQKFVLSSFYKCITSCDMNLSCFGRHFLSLPYKQQKTLKNRSISDLADLSNQMLLFLFLIPNRLIALPQLGSTWQASESLFIHPINTNNSNISLTNTQRVASEGQTKPMVSSSGVWI